MTWAIFGSWSCFCWLYRVSPSLAAKNIISLILVLTIWWCPCVEPFLVLLEKSVCYDQCILLAKLCCLWPASFCTPRPILPVTSHSSWLPTFEFQSSIMERTSFWVLVLEGLVGFPGGSDGKDSPAVQDPWIRKIPWRRKWQPTPEILSREFHEQRSLAGYSPWACKESGMTEQLSL